MTILSWLSALLVIVGILHMQKNTPSSSVDLSTMPTSFISVGIVIFVVSKNISILILFKSVSTILVSGTLE